MNNSGVMIRLLNVGLRGATLASKFLLIFVLAKYLQPSALGIYGLLVVTIAYSIYPLGFEFYTFSSRELVRTNIRDRAQKLKNQAFMHGVLYVFVMPALILLFLFGLLPWRLAPLFFLLVILEHLNQEAMRLLIALQYQLASSVALFLRQGLWALALVGVMFFYPEYRSVEYILVGWCIGGLLGLSLSVYVLLGISTVKNNSLGRVEWDWVLNGMKICLPLFLASLSVNFITTIDRYWFSALQGESNLGAYVFYMSITSAMITFMDAGIFSFSYPRLLACHASGDEVGFLKSFRSMLIQVVLMSILFVSVVCFFSNWFFLLLEKPVYIENISVFYILVIMSILQVFSYIPHYGLYAKGQDRDIVLSNILSVPVFLFSVFILSQYSSLYAIPVALCIVYGFVFLYKTCAYSFRIQPGEVVI